MSGAKLPVLLACGTLVIAGCSSRPASREPLNLSHAKAAVTAYVDSGRYEQELEAVSREARAWLERRVAQRREGERLAIVLDVDETALSNLVHMRALDFGYQSAVWHRWVAKAEATAIVPVRALYDAARMAGVAVVFVTGREEPVDRPGTEANLKREGMGDYLRLVLTGPTDSAHGAADSKTRARAALEREGYAVIATVGDQWSDLNGGHAERVFKLPNPFYATP